MTIAPLNQRVGGTYFFGDPLASVLGLPASGAPAGMLRLTLDTQVPYVWNGSSGLPLPAGAWPVLVAGADCTAYLPGTLARDAADDLYLCKTNAPRNWKKCNNDKCYRNNSCMPRFCNRCRLISSEICPDRAVAAVKNMACLR